MKKLNKLFVAVLFIAGLSSCYHEDDGPYYNDDCNYDNAPIKVNKTVQVIIKDPKTDSIVPLKKGSIRLSETVCQFDCYSQTCYDSEIEHSQDFEADNNGEFIFGDKLESVTAVEVLYEDTNGGIWHKWAEAKDSIVTLDSTIKVWVKLVYTTPMKIKLLNNSKKYEGIKLHKWSDEIIWGYNMDSSLLFSVPGDRYQSIAYTLYEKNAYQAKDTFIIMDRYVSSLDSNVFTIEY